MPLAPKSSAHMPRPDLILSSMSAVRSSLLRNAGLNFEVMDSRVDEDSIKTEFGEANKDTNALTLKLASAKAISVAVNASSALVIGADQILSCDGKRYDKPRDLAEARTNLQAFRNKTHCLHSAIVLAQGADIIWSHVAQAHLTMRDFTDEFLDAYLAALGDKVKTSVGCYQLEGPGIQLFDRIEGDYFTILGLPLIPLLDELRRRRVAQS